MLLLYNFRVHKHDTVAEWIERVPCSAEARVRSQAATHVLVVLHHANTWRPWHVVWSEVVIYSDSLHKFVFNLLAFSPCNCTSNGTCHEHVHDGWVAKCWVCMHKVVSSILTSDHAISFFKIFFLNNLCGLKKIERESLLGLCQFHWIFNVGY